MSSSHHSNRSNGTDRPTSEQLKPIDLGEVVVNEPHINDTDSVPTESESSQKSVTINTHPVFYESERGSTLSEGRVVMSREDGTRIIITHDRAPPRKHHQKLTERKLKIINVLAVVAIIVFFPSGIPALIFAQRSERQFFSRGVLRGDLDLAKKYARWSQRLIILSFIVAVLIIALVFAILGQDGSVISGNTGIAGP